MKYIINYKSTGEVEQETFTADQWRFFETNLWHIIRFVSNHPETEENYEILIDGSSVSIDLAQKAVNHVRKEYQQLLNVWNS